MGPREGVLLGAHLGRAIVTIGSASTVGGAVWQTVTIILPKSNASSKLLLPVLR